MLRSVRKGEILGGNHVDAMISGWGCTQRSDERKRGNGDGAGESRFGFSIAG